MVVVGGLLGWMVLGGEDLVMVVVGGRLNCTTLGAFPALTLL